MNWLENWNKVIDYIEENLYNEINMEEISKIVFCSGLHFQRMFSYLTDMTLNEYIRKRKMTRACEELQKSDIKIIDLSLKYGYDSPTAFNRAFKNVMEISPSAARKKGAILKAYTKISFKIIIKGESEMKYRIEEKEAFRIIGLKRHYKGIEELIENVQDFWEEASQKGVITKLCGLMDREPFGVLGVYSNSSRSEFEYYIAASSNREVPKDFSAFDIPKAQWAIFECKGKMPDAIKSLQKRIMTEWLPSSGYKLADAPDVEVYFEGDHGSEDYHCEVWIPVTKG